MIYDASQCTLCESLKVDTASEYSWICPINNSPICETHCAEVQLPSYIEARINFREIIGLEGNPDQLLSYCEVCPYDSKHTV